MTRRATVRHQRGAVLFVSLIMLVVLTLFAVAGFNLSSVNLRIAGNFQSQKRMEAVAQEAIERVISTLAAFSLTPSAQTFTIDGYTVNVSAPSCNYSTIAKYYTKKLDELVPDDNDWEVRASVTDSFTSAQATIVQGVRIRMLAGNCRA